MSPHTPQPKQDKRSTKAYLASLGAGALIALTPIANAVADTTAAPAAPDTQTNTQAPATGTTPAQPNALQSAEERLKKPAPTAKAPAGQSAEKPEVSQKKEFVGLPVFTTDGQRIGRVSDIAVGTDGKVSAIRAKVGGFFGFGAKLVEIPAGSFEKSGKAVKLAMTSKQADDLPAVSNETKS